MPAHPSDTRAVPVNTPVDEAAPAQDENRLAGADWQENVPPGRELWRFFREYLASLVAVTRWRLLAAVLLMSLTSVTEGIGVALLFPVLQVAGFNMTNQGHVGHYTGEVQDLLRWSGLRPSLWLATLLMSFMLLMAVRSLFGRAQAVQTMSTAMRYEMALSRHLYQAIINADWRYLVRRRSSDFTHALTGELSRVTTATYQFMGLLSSTTLGVVYVGLALKLSAVTTLMVLISGAALLLVSRGWMRAVHESGVALSESMNAVYAAATEHLQSLKSIKTYDAQAADLAMFTSLENSALDQSLRITRNQAAAAFWFEAGSLVVLAGVIFLSLRVLRVGPANVLLLLAIFTRLMPRLAAGYAQLQGFLGDLPAFTRVMRMNRECGLHAEAAATPEPSLVLRHELRMDGVGFQYEASRSFRLEDISLTVAAGKITAIVGPSGAGKSTIADMVNGLLTPTSGRILVDDTPLTPERARAWRRQVGYVAQDTVLFHASVRSNLLWAKPDAGEDELSDALTLAAAEFAFSLPQGLETVVGDRGVLLSNGQRQRIALARALLRRPSLLVLDEATNSLDLENEGRILDTIESLRERITILMIAHRSSAVERAEMIYVVEDGRVVESGAWANLSWTKGRSAALLTHGDDLVV